MRLDWKVCDTEPAPAFSCVGGRGMLWPEYEVAPPRKLPTREGGRGGGDLGFGCNVSDSFLFIFIAREVPPGVVTVNELVSAGFWIRFEVAVSLVIGFCGLGLESSAIDLLSPWSELLVFKKERCPAMVYESGLLAPGDIGSERRFERGE